MSTERKLFGTRSSLKGWVGLCLGDWAYCASVLKLSAQWRLYCQIPHGSTAFSTVWPSNMRLFAWAHLVSLVPWVQTAISSKPAENFRLELALLALRLTPLFLLAAAVFARGVRSIFSASQRVLADLGPCAGRLIFAFSFSTTHTHSNKAVWSSTVLAKSSNITPSLSSVCCCV